MLVIGSRINGARRWIESPATFSRSELAKLRARVWAAAYLAQRPRRVPSRSSAPDRAAARRLLRADPREPDLGTAISLVVLLLAVLPDLGTRSPTLAPGTSIAVASSDSRLVRALSAAPSLVSSILKDPHGAGFQTVQALISFCSGGFPGGRARPRRRQESNYLPRRTPT